MADPLSIAASIITVIGAADSIGRTLGKITSAKNAPAAIHALQNEISDVRIVLGDVDIFTSTSGEDLTGPTFSSTKCLEHLAVLTDRAKSKIAELDQIVHRRLIRCHPVTGVTHLSRVEWLKVRGVVEELHRNLRPTRQDMALQMMSINSCDTRIAYPCSCSR